MPPTEKRKYSLLSDLAMDLAMDVLPTPGGPWKQRILPCVVPTEGGKVDCTHKVKLRL